MKTISWLIVVATVAAILLKNSSQAPAHSLADGSVSPDSGVTTGAGVLIPPSAGAIPLVAENAATATHSSLQDELADLRLRYDSLVEENARLESEIKQHWMQVDVVAKEPSPKPVQAAPRYTNYSSCGPAGCSGGILRRGFFRRR